MSPSPHWRNLLWPLSLPYAAAARLRVWCYRTGVLRSRRLAGTVISVGNLTAGGTGKTPMVMWLADQLAAEGKHAAILTRGYRGNGNGSSGEPQSDEVSLLRAHFSDAVKIGVGADRYQSGERLTREGADCFVLDDGYQHLRLARDADILLLDALDPFGGGMPLPAGLLREPVRELRRADIIVITRCAEPPARELEAVVRRYTQRPIFYAATMLIGVLQLPQLVRALPRDEWSGTRFFAFCGIGNPHAFFHDLRRWEFQLVGTRAFADHHVYAQREFAALQESAKRAGADALLCTEKDVWNLRHVSLDGIPVYCCRIALELPQPAFRRELDAVVQARRELAR